MAMKNILLDLDDWQKRLRLRPLAVFLDYDGTLSAIAPTPAEATLPHATREILKALLKLKHVKVAVISGRALNDLRKMVPVPGLVLAGSHGIEFRMEGLPSKCVPRRYFHEMHGLRRRLKDKLQDVAGVLFEQKPFSCAIHYRKALPGSGKKIKQVVRDACDEAVRQGKVVVLSGKKVIEIMPPGAMDKGRVVARLLRLWGKKRFLPVFIGDDQTDEAAFKVVRKRGLTVRVGTPSKRSKAQYFLNGVEDVRMLLEMILYLRNS